MSNLLAAFKRQESDSEGSNYEEEENEFAHEEIRHHSDDETPDKKPEPKAETQTLEHKGLHTSKHVYSQDNQPPVQIKKKKDHYLYRGEEAPYESDEEGQGNKDEDKGQKNKEGSQDSGYVPKKKYYQNDYKGKDNDYNSKGSGYQKKNWKNDRNDKNDNYQSKNNKYKGDYEPKSNTKYENRYEKYETIYEPKVKTEAPKTEPVKTETTITTASQPFNPKSTYIKNEYKSDYNNKYDNRNDKGPKKYETYNATPEILYVPKNKANEASDPTNDVQEQSPPQQKQYSGYSNRNNQNNNGGYNKYQSQKFYPQNYNQGESGDYQYQPNYKPQSGGYNQPNDESPTTFEKKKLSQNAEPFKKAEPRKLQDNSVEFVPSNFKSSEELSQEDKKKLTLKLTSESFKPVS